MLVGIITRNDPDNLKKCLDSVLTAMSHFDHIIDVMIINDGTPYPSGTYKGFENVIQHSQIKHNSACYNEILRYAIDEGIKDVFLLQDNIVIKAPEVFARYQETAYTSNLTLMCYGQEKVMGADQQMYPNCRAKINYTDEVGIALNADTTGAFTYVNTAYVEKLGFFDERYKSVLELADYFYRGVEAGYCPPWGWFPDILNAQEYLDVTKSKDNTPMLRSRIMHAAALFQYKWSCLPEKIAVLPLESAKESLKIIKAKKYDSAV